MLNRSALILHPKQPFIDWINQRRGGVFTSRGDDERTVYLVPELYSLRDLHRILERIYPELFERELEGWYMDQSLWPQNRTLELFTAWFKVECQSMVVDLCLHELVDDEAES